jgi:hypothetical protein
MTAMNPLSDPAAAAGSRVLVEAALAAVIIMNQLVTCENTMPTQVSTRIRRISLEPNRGQPAGHVQAPRPR